MVYQDTTFKICLSLFSWKVKILNKEHIVQCGVHRQAEVLYRFDLYTWNDILDLSLKRLNGVLK